MGKEWDAQLIQLDNIPKDGEEIRNWLGEGNVKVLGGRVCRTGFRSEHYSGEDRNTRIVWVGGRLAHERRVSMLGSSRGSMH